MRKALEVIGAAALAAMFWMTWSALTGPNHLRDKIPTHFDVAGRPNAWGSSITLFLLPVVGSLIYISITVVSQFTSAFNYPVRVTPENRPRLEALAIRMITWLKVELICLFLWIQSSTIDAARHQTLGLPLLLMPVSLLAVFGTMSWYIVAMRRAAKPQ
jgi:uncharacterized membrane protein